MYEKEQIEQYLSNLYENFILDSRQGVSKLYRAKCLGAMETLLIILGKLEIGSPYEYKSFPYQFKLFWLIPISLSTKENYTEFILRKTKEALNIH